MYTAADYKTLQLWQDALDICVKVFQATHRLPLQERGGMYRRLRAQSEVIPMLVARGYESPHAATYKSHLDKALESLDQIHLQVSLAERLEYLSPLLTDELDLQIGSFRAQLRRMISFLDCLESSLNPTFAYSYLHAHVA